MCADSRSFVQPGFPQSHGSRCPFFIPHACICSIAHSPAALRFGEPVSNAREAMTSAVRPAEPRDAEAIAALCEQAAHRLESYRDPFYASGPDHAAWLRASVDRLLGSQDAVALVHEGTHGVDALLLGRLAGALGPRGRTEAAMSPKSNSSAAKPLASPAPPRSTVSRLISGASAPRGS